MICVETLNHIRHMRMAFLQYEFEYVTSMFEDVEILIKNYLIRILLVKTFAKTINHLFKAM